ncbi:NAD(P)-dependent oxidoreductase [Clostridium perfringens]|uniref:NAD-dependent epimerase/dehydratase family protein n=1 Tax=Clostridium perfringens TaxID=1502 RepID=UPI001A26A63B|nr:NAD(P)-dependent oxidoreductase [Clostridium perfringens]MBO3326927.1 NAD(P)-dependent oxidoreductase [Clostridium perfringens]HAT4356447.1 NAD(P)-dependent oxidoreductase [Clostridium perfringens]
MLIGITGATGSLGRRLTEILIKQGYNVRCLVRKNSNYEFLINEKVEIIYGDILDFNSLKLFVNDLDICIHLAAQVSKSKKKVLFNINVNGSINICEALLQFNPSCRFLYCSSIVVRNYKSYKKLFYSDYTISKYKAEKAINKYMKKLKTTIIYPGYIYGYYDNLVIPTIKNMLKNGLDFLVKGGERNAPIIFVDDLCDLFIKAMLNDNAINKKYVSLQENSLGMHYVVKKVANILNYQTPKKIYSKFLIRIIMKIYKCRNKLFKSNKNILSLREINILSNSAIYFNNAKEDINWEQKTSIDEGLNKAVEFYIKYNK